jgi:hypothetical protein
MQPGLAMQPSLYCRTHADTRQIAKQSSGGEFRACGQKFFFVSPKSVSPGYVEGDGHL